MAKRITHIEVHDYCFLQETLCNFLESSNELVLLSSGKHTSQQRNDMLLVLFKLGAQVVDDIVRLPLANDISDYRVTVFIDHLIQLLVCFLTQIGFLDKQNSQFGFEAKFKAHLQLVVQAGQSPI